MARRLVLYQFQFIKNAQTGFSAFNINADEDVVHFSYAIEDTMKKF